MSDQVNALLTDRSKGIRRHIGVLTHLFRQVLLWRKIDRTSWNKRVHKYFKKPHNKHLPYDKGNLNKDLVRDEFTWANFKKAIDFLNPIGATLSIRLHWRSGLTSYYSIKIDPAEDESDIEHEVEEDQSEIFKEEPKAANTLARLYRHIIVNEGIDIERWNALLNDYATNPYNGVVQSRVKINEVISTMERSLLKPRMTWNVFRKGMLLLNYTQVEYILTLRWSEKSGEESQYIVRIDNPMELTVPTHQTQSKDAHAGHDAG